MANAARPPPAAITAISAASHRDPTTVRRAYDTGRCTSTTRAAIGPAGAALGYPLPAPPVVTSPAPSRATSAPAPAEPHHGAPGAAEGAST